MNNKLINLLAEQYGVSADSITADTNILDLGADSLDIVETQISIEKEFNIDIETSEYENRTTVKDLLDLIVLKLGTVPN
jgi:acyl carrier protein